MFHAAEFSVVLKQIAFILNYLKPLLCYLMLCALEWTSSSYILSRIHLNELYRHTCLAPEGIKKSISGPRPKKVVHHWCKTKKRAN